MIKDSDFVMVDRDKIREAVTGSGETGTGSLGTWSRTGSGRLERYHVKRDKIR